MSYGPRERRDKLGVVAAPPPLLLFPSPSPFACGKKGTSKFVGLPNVAEGLIKKKKKKGIGDGGVDDGSQTLCCHSKTLVVAMKSVYL